MKRIYLDYAASTPMAPEVERAMWPHFVKIFGNPSSIHREGQQASATVFLARQKIAASLGCDYKEIIFTGSATEANNLALRGALRAYQRITNRGRMNESRAEFVDSKEIRNSLMRPRIIISAIEHESIAETCRDLECEGVEVVRIPVSREGIIDLEKLEAALNERTILVSIIYANNEVGTVQPIREVANLVQAFRTKVSLRQAQGIKFLVPERSRGTTLFPLLHTDAAQAFQYLPCRVDELGVDLMTLSAHKIYGPKGIGLLYQKSKIKNQNDKSKFKVPNFDGKIITPIITGAEQEFGLRAGTENVPYIVGFGEAVALADKMRVKEAARVKKLRDYFWNKLKSAEGKCPLSHPIGGDNGHFVELNSAFNGRLPNNLNIHFPKRKAHDFLIALDIKGVAASAGSACHARVAAPSSVIIAMGYGKERATKSARFTLGRGTTKEEIDRVTEIIKEIYFIK